MFAPIGENRVSGLRRGGDFYTPLIRIAIYNAGAGVAAHCSRMALYDRKTARPQKALCAGSMSRLRLSVCFTDIRRCVPGVGAGQGISSGCGGAPRL